MSGGEANSYYAGAAPEQGQYQNQYQNPNQGQYQSPPQNNYQNGNHDGGAPPQYHMDMGGKQEFSQMFAIEKPKYHDIWAGLLVSGRLGRARRGRG